MEKPKKTPRQTAMRKGVFPSDLYVREDCFRIHRRLLLIWLHLAEADEAGFTIGSHDSLDSLDASR